jgi:GT2 family glycosyltransferase
VTERAWPEVGRDGADARIAAIVVNHRTVAETLLAVGSLRASRRAPDLILIVDNGSGDGSAAALQGPGQTVVALEHNLGFAAGANAGIRVALARQARAVFLLNSDARVHPECLGLLEAALAPPAVGIAGPTLLRWGAPDTIESQGIVYAPLSGRMRHRGAGARLPRGATTRSVDGIAGTAMLIKREVLDSVGLFDEDYFLYYEDLDLCWRARRAGFGSVCVDAARAWHRGAYSVGARSPERVYWAARGHLRLAARARPLPCPLDGARVAAVVGWNAAHLVVRRAAPLGPGARALGRALWDHLRRAGPRRG